MSQWTHVGGAVRLDMIQFGTDGAVINQVKSIFGNTYSYEDKRSVRDVCTVPCGSEGSVQYKVKLTGTPSSLARVVVTVWGDLRDYDDTEEIVAWVKGVVKKLNEKGIGVRGERFILKLSLKRMCIFCGETDKSGLLILSRREIRSKI